MENFWCPILVQFIIKLDEHVRTSLSHQKLPVKHQTRDKKTHLNVSRKPKYVSHFASLFPENFSIFNVSRFSIELTATAGKSISAKVENIILTLSRCFRLKFRQKFISREQTKNKHKPLSGLFLISPPFLDKILESPTELIPKYNPQQPIHAKSATINNK